MLLATWNTLGLTPAEQILSDGHCFSAQYNLAPDFICLQEIGNAKYESNLGRAFSCKWNYPCYQYHRIDNYELGKATYRGYHVPWSRISRGNQRCSMAILWQVHIGDFSAFPITGWTEKMPAYRPVFWITTPERLKLGCIHGPSGGNLGYLRTACDQISVGAANWLLAGDINIEPSALSPNMQRIDSGVPTHRSGKNIDYLVYGGSIPFASASCPQQVVGNSDHYQVRFA